MVLEKARGKVVLQPGFSLMAWMRLSNDGTDLTGGARAVDEDEDEASWKEWTLDEVKKHGSPDDAWMALHGRVYNITPYLNYHPGGVDTLLEVAGTDGTALFDKYHSWVNSKGIMQACCVGRLTLRGGGSDAAPFLGSDTVAAHVGATSAADDVRDTAAAEVGDTAVGSPVNGHRPRKVRWDEEGIQAHDAERGVMFGTMKVDHVETPYLYLDVDDSAAINSKYLPALVPKVVPPNVPGPYKMPVAALEHALGLLKTDEDGLVNLPRPKWAPAEFGVQRQELYTGEASVAVLSRDLPGAPPHLLLRADLLLCEHLLALSTAAVLSHPHR